MISTMTGGRILRLDLDQGFTCTPWGAPAGFDELIAPLDADQRRLQPSLI